MAADNNQPYAQYFLGLLYSNKSFIDKDINKAIHYFSLAANQNDLKSLYSLGELFLKGELVARDINKAINYFSLAAKQDHKVSQYALGYIYIQGLFVDRNIIKGIDYLIQSSSNNYWNAHFPVGYFYHEGKYVDRDVKKCIKYYKLASSFNSQYAKNNLGVIYKNGIDEIPINHSYAIIYFKEAINRFDDKLSVYNLLHLYIFDIKSYDEIDELIPFIFKASMNSFLPVIYLLCIALILKNEFDIINIKNDLFDKTKQYSQLSDKIYQIIVDEKLCVTYIFQDCYQYF